MAGRRAAHLPAVLLGALADAARQVAGAVASLVADWVGENSMQLRGDSDIEFYPHQLRQWLQDAVTFTGFRCRNCLRRRNISRRIVRITDADASVLSPRVRGK